MARDPVALVIDEYGVQRLQMARVDKSWFEEFQVPSGEQGLKRHSVDDIVYLLSTKASLESKLLIIALGRNGVFEQAASPRHAFDRIIHLALATFSNAVAIPKAWKQYTQGSKLSIYAQPFHQSGQRLYVDRTHDDGHLFVYGITDDVQEFDRVEYPESTLRAVRDRYADALLYEPDHEQVAPAVGGGRYGIVLDTSVGTDYVAAASLDEWTSQKLTQQQRRFVETAPDQPIRLRGAAGTGKTLCLVIKCLTEHRKALDDGRASNIAFVTHSAGVAHDVVQGMMQTLDPENHRAGGNPIWIGSIYELAKERLNYQSKGIVPLSLDGAAGRKEQKEYLSLFIEECLGDSYFARSLLPNCSGELQSKLNQKPLAPRFLAEVMNEISCVLDAEGIRLNRPEKVQRYLTATRELWQMRLPTVEDRKAVLEIYERYYRYLAESNIISLDQMIADLLRYLDSHEWAYLRNGNGYDLIFVDELHYFNYSERMVFHYLFREAARRDGKLPLFMAYDLKQSPDDRFLSSSEGGEAGRFFQSIRAGKSTLVELTEVFRSSPEIAQFLEAIDGSFPALDLEGEWSVYGGVSKQARGEIPELRVYPTEIAMLDEIVGEAYRSARSLGGGRKVAILCMNEELFAKYIVAGRIAKKITVVESRTQLRELQYAGKRCIFSMPDYVAGLQFETVYVINVDRSDMSDEDSIGAKRRFLSRLYLGASRASRTLILAACAERGGYPEFLNGALASGYLQKADR